MMLVLLVDRWSSLPSERFAGKTVVLDGADATHDSGHAYWLSLRWAAPGLASDKDGVSRIVFLEDGVALAGRALHADVRQRGGGLFSHWGSAILFSTRDGSDPRTNGHRYEVRLPPAPPIWHRGAQIGLLAVASVLLLSWLHGRLGGSLLRTGLWATGGATVLAALALGSVLWSSPARELRAMREALGQNSAVAPTPELSGVRSSTGERARTRHLLRNADTASFFTEAALPAARQPREIELRTTAETRNGLVELDDESRLHNVTPLDIPAADLELMVLELGVIRGGSLSLKLSSCEKLGGIALNAVLTFEVQASRELQEIHFRRPALGAMDCVRDITLQEHSSRGKPALLRTVSLRYRLRLDAFADRVSGFSPVELEDGLRPTLWQSFD